MAKGLNEVTLMGFLPRDPETKSLANGTTITNMTVGCPEWRKDKGEEVVEWVRVVLFGKPAQNAKDYLQKGSNILLKGKITTQNWEDKEGNKRQSVQVLGSFFIMLDGKPKKQESKPQENNNDPIPDDDLPF